MRLSLRPLAMPAIWHGWRTVRDARISRLQRRDWNESDCVVLLPVNHRGREGRYGDAGLSATCERVSTLFTGYWKTGG